MTVAQLKERMDARFKAVDKRFGEVDKRFDLIDARFDRLSARMEARFDSLNEKIGAVLRISDDKYRHHDTVLHEHEQRIKDLERPANE